MQFRNPSKAAALCIVAAFFLQIADTSADCVPTPAGLVAWWSGDSDANDLLGATGSTLTLTNVTRDSRGFYSALVWNSLGSKTSREAWLDVVGPVRLLPQGADVSNALVSFGVTDSTGNSLAAEDAGWLSVQASSNLVNWQTITNSLLFTNSTLLLQDPAQSNFPTRFYRLIEK